MLSDAVKYKPMTVGARTVRTFTQRVQPTSGATAYPLDGSSQITFQIPQARNCVIMWHQSRMQGRLNPSITSAAANIEARIDHSVYSCFKRSVCSMDGVGQIESINEIGKLLCLWKDLTSDPSQQGSYDGLLEGAQSATDFGAGLSLLPAANTSGSTFTPKYSFSCLIPMGMAMSDMAFPSFAVAGKNLELAITLAHANECLYATSGSTIVTPSTTANYLDQVELILQVVQYSDEAMDVIRAAAGPELFFSYKSFDANAFLTASGTNSITLNSNKRSVLALLGGFWSTTKTNSATRLTGHRSIAGGITEMWLDVDGAQIPQQHLTAVATTSSATAGNVINHNQFVAELLNVVNQFNNSYRPGALDVDIYYPVSGSADVSHFAFGIDLELQPSASVNAAGVWTGRDFSQTASTTLNITVGAARQMYTWYLHCRTLRIDQQTGQVTLLY